MLRTVTVAAFATALAAPALAHADEPASTQPWSNVSHINGQLVKVGERNDYLVNNTKRVNIATNPIGYLFGFYGLSVSVAVGEHLTVRGNVEKLDYEFFGHVDGHELSLSTPLYFRRAFSGPFLEPGIRYRETLETGWDLFGDGGEPPTAHTYAGPMMLFGWHWTFDSGLNLAVALGASRNMHRSVDGDYMSNDPDPTGYFRVGYAF